jgi:uncharacterized protein YndB with AHSA1/START domain
MSSFRSLALMFLFLAAGVSDEELARGGRIRDGASVHASVRIVIHAPAEKVWSVLTDIPNWPKWQGDISAAQTSGPVEAGMAFSWTIGGTHIKSRLAQVHPYSQLAWTGKAFGASAIHVWKLSRTADRETTVATDESMDGFLLTLFYSSKKLAASDQLWLERLKAASE